VSRYRDLSTILPGSRAAYASTAEAKCNEIFAFAAALGILEVEFSPDTPQKLDFWLRVLDVITASRSETLEPYVVDVQYETQREWNAYDLTIHPNDKLPINSLISIFELLSKKRDAIC
jgi:hypothetical protein